MRVADLRFLFDYDRWAMRRILAASAGIDEATWSAVNVVDERGLGGILVHALGAHQRWRNGWQATGERPRPEREPLPSVERLTDAWEREWQAFDAWFATVDDAWLGGTDEGVPIWQTLVHLVNHGTQHRSEAAALLTEAGRSPGDLDLIFFAEERAAEEQAAEEQAAEPPGRA